MGLVFSISNFFINKTYQANKLSAKKIPSCAISNDDKMIFWLSSLVSDFQRSVWECSCPWLAPYIEYDIRNWRLEICIGTLVTVDYNAKFNIDSLTFNVLVFSPALWAIVDSSTIFLFPISRPQSVIQTKHKLSTCIYLFILPLTVLI